MPRSVSFVLLFLCCSVGVTAHAAGLPDFSAIVAKQSPAVVKILTESEGEDEFGGLDPRYYEQLPPMFRDFLFRGQPRQQPRRSMGSGFFVSDDGYLLTNHHVVDGADSITVRLSDRREFSAEIVGTDARSDLALLKVDEKGLPTASFGDSDDLRVGQWVLAIGSPFGLDYSVTAGIVSAIGRSIPTERGENYVPFIQTDVAINPGNSGGPLFNLDGEVIGINSQIYTRSGGSIGLSFAIPSAVALDVMRQLKDQGRVSRGWLGVSIQEVDLSLAESFGLDKPQGALISQLEVDGPAERAGLEVGDIILEFNGEPIDTSSELPHVVGLTRPGSTAEVKVLRDRRTRTIDVEIGSLEADEVPSLAAAPQRAGGRLGAVVEDLPERMRERWKLDEGVLLRELDPDGPLAQAGLAEGDVITRIGDQVVDDPDAFARIAENLPVNTHVPVRFVRQGRSGFVAIRIEE